MIEFASAIQPRVFALVPSDVECVARQLDELESVYTHYCSERDRVGHSILIDRLNELNLTYGNVSMECVRIRHQKVDDEIANLEPSECADIPRALREAGSLMQDKRIYRPEAEPCISQTVESLSESLQEICENGLFTPRTTFDAGYAEIFERCRDEF